MKILLIPSFWNTHKDPTLGSFFMSQAIALTKLGHHVDVVYCDTFSIKYISDYIRYDEEEHITKNGVKIYRKKLFAPLKRNNGLYGNAQLFVKGITDIYFRYLSNNKYDVIHAHCCAWAGVAARSLSIATKIPYVITEHSTLYALHDHQIRKSEDQLIREAFMDAAGVICVGKNLESLIKKYTDDIKVIGNIVELDLFSANTAKAVDINEYTFLTICYMKNLAQIKKKGIDVLISASKELRKNYPNFKLLLGGGGSGTEIVKHWVSEAGISENVEFLGTLTRAQVANAMQRCDCFVLPSRYETFGVVFIEAMAAGKPVIATVCGGPEDFIDESLGTLVNVEDITGLHEAMLQMIANHNSYDSNHLIEFVKENYSYQAIGNKLVQMYQEILRAKNNDECHATTI